MPKHSNVMRLMKKLPMQQRFGYRFNMIGAALAQHTLLRVRREFDLNLAEYRVISALAAFDSPSTRDIAKNAQMDKAHVTITLSRLMKRNLVTQIVDPNDRRLRRVRLTAAGWQLAVAFAPFQLERQKRMQRRVSASELHIFWKVMAALSKEVEQMLAEEQAQVAAGPPRKVTLSD
jgi:DNA-binding MarR family transcriptional regulator